MWMMCIYLTDSVGTGDHFQTFVCTDVIDNVRSYCLDTTGTCQWGFHCGFEPQPGIPGAPEMPCRLLPVNQ